MLTTIWRVPLLVTASQTVVVPRGAVPLSVGVIGESVVAWVLVDPDARGVAVSVWVVGTGDAVGAEVDVGGYLGTVQRGASASGWCHVFWSRSRVEPDLVEDSVRDAAIAAAAAIMAADADYSSAEGGDAVDGWGPE